MTICAAVRDSHIEHLVHLASDTKGTFVGMVIPSAPKWKRASSSCLAIGHAGSFRAASLIYNSIDQIGKKCKKPGEIANALKSILLQDKWNVSDDDKSSPQYFGENYIAVGEFGPIFIDGEFGWTIRQPGEPIFIGSGGHLAAAAWHVLNIEDDKTRLERAVTTAIELSTTCNGGPVVETINILPRRKKRCVQGTSSPRSKKKESKKKQKK